MADDEIDAVVVDCGSGYTKAGFSSDDAPRTVFPTIIGRPKMPGIMVGTSNSDLFVGKEAVAKRGVLVTNEPISRGIITNWDDMEKVYHHTFYQELKIAPEEHTIMLTDTPQYTKSNREKMTQLMFETFNVPAMYIGVDNVMALYQAGKTTGVVLDIGHGVTNATAIYEGYCYHHATVRVPLGGRDLTEELGRVLSNKGYSVSSVSDAGYMEEVKEKHCYVSQGYEEEKKSIMEGGGAKRTCVLPDGVSVTLGEEVISVPEMLFKPGNGLLGVDECIIGCVDKCDSEIRKELYGNVILSGGGSLFGGLQERLQRELSASSSTSKIKVTANPERKYSAWCGASILASLDTFRQMWVSKHEFDECGPSIINRKCF